MHGSKETCSEKSASATDTQVLVVLLRSLRCVELILICTPQLEQNFLQFYSIDGYFIERTAYLE